MIDKLMSRRCLIEAAAGALLLSGCSSQDESSTKKVKKQDKIKKAEASDQSKHLRDKDELYEVYDDSGIVTMYLTVSRGNSSENTDHSWAEINTYSVYDYADMGVTRYQVMGLLQPGDEDGPVARLAMARKRPMPPCKCVVRHRAITRKRITRWSSKRARVPGANSARLRSTSTWARVCVFATRWPTTLSVGFPR
jgi:hypothetical protein